MQKHEKILLIDGDGVVLNFSRGYVKFLREVHGIHSVGGDEPSEFTFKDLFPHVEKPWAHIKSFTESFEHFSAVQAYDSARKFLPMIKQSGIADKIFMLTSCGTSSSTMAARRACIEREIPSVVDEILFFDLGESKLDALKKFSRSVLIDDLKSHCDDAVKAGHSAILYSQLYNKNDVVGGDIRRISCFSELL